MKKANSMKQQAKLNVAITAFTLVKTLSIALTTMPQGKAYITK